MSVIDSMRYHIGRTLLFFFHLFHPLVEGMLLGLLGHLVGNDLAALGIHFDLCFTMRTSQMEFFQFHEAILMHQTCRNKPLENLVRNAG